ncbi:MAG TPA: precorrin-8X methylmutase [Candidatus Avacidaminococcus intestinavium]|uniref:Precorrin-8X methylmutase n=1 Tax=Candidatus Avacidaminococcus intestinavium TaxID=2840684 RepID=A0A9D1SM85_9FIRM|nr:precorrin-8X methylmutase [Candidatus Avacidaminococcus intestinavium]
MNLENVLPGDIEKRSMEIIQEELGEIILDETKASIIKRVIHTSADFDYVRTLHFSPDAIDKALAALKNGATIITDTNMAKAGVNKIGLAKLGAKVECFMLDADVAATAKEKGCTRAAVCMEKACEVEGPVIIAVGNAPTALVRLNELIAEGKIKPELVIGVPVGFVNVVESKEIIMSSGVPYIVARGRKGGSNVAAAICNALIYKLAR